MILSLKGCLTITYSDMAKATRPSAQRHFTSVFGMGTGGTDALYLSGETCKKSGKHEFEL